MPAQSGDVGTAKQRLRRIGGGALLLGVGLVALAYLFVAAGVVAKVEVPAVATTVISLGLAIYVVAELLPFLKSLKIGGAEIELVGNLQDQINELKTSEAETRRALVAAMPAARSLAAAPAAAPLPAAPALQRPVKRADDRNFGRFGGSPRNGGFELDARVDAIGDRWARLALTVTAPPGATAADDAAEFYLHEGSFRQPRVLVLFRDGRAEYSAVIWGGFTVGVWIPAHDVELELDLATLPGVPDFIRDR